MSSPGSVHGDERLRLFLALQLPEDVLTAIHEWQARELSGRLVPRHNLHVTLAFLGSRPARELEPICAVLAESAAAVAPPLLGGGSYRETRSAGMLVLSDRTGDGALLAGRLQHGLAELGVYEPERRPWLPHVTVVRYRERPRRSSPLAPPPPELPGFAPSGAAAFLSRLHPSGARYTAPDYIVLKSFPLGG